MNYPWLFLTSDSSISSPGVYGCHSKPLQEHSRICRGFLQSSSRTTGSKQGNNWTFRVKKRTSQMIWRASYCQLPAMKEIQHGSCRTGCLKQSECWQAYENRLEVKYTPRKFSQFHCSIEWGLSSQHKNFSLGLSTHLIAPCGHT